nr:class I SAM-dependent methyltransferase [Planctomycetota bacterium]
MRPWYLSAFDDGYLERYAHRDAAEAERQIAALAGALPLRAGERVLDLCCGAGRHFAPLLARGLVPFGADLSAALLRAAAQGAAALRLCRADMRRLPFAPASFDAVLQLFTSFGYFQDDQENRLVLAEVARVARPGARYVLDLMNAAHVLRTLVPRSARTRGDGALIEERRWFDARARRMEKRVRLTPPGGAASERAESVRVFALDEIARWLEAAGFALLAAQGDYAGAAYDAADSPRMVLIAAARR